MRLQANVGVLAIIGLPKNTKGATLIELLPLLIFHRIFMLQAFLVAFVETTKRLV